MNASSPVLIDLPAELGPDGYAVVCSPARLRAVAALLDAGDAMAAQLSEVARQITAAFGVRAAAVNLVLAGSVAVVASHGMPASVLEAGGLPGEWGPCTDVVDTNAAVLIDDLGERYPGGRNAVMTVNGIRAYAGVPLRLQDQVVGALCVFDDRTRAVTAEMVAVLAVISDDIMEMLLRAASGDVLR
ncbi:GAF domain-containing protein [Actinoplanes sp. NPDC049802]|uniref:GAF domain-containing protein n=1 Tax=Actinoplanes sp. NPDC049802 TaxID=3154742 RepID=UPI0033DC3F1D